MSEDPMGLGLLDEATSEASEENYQLKDGFIDSEAGYEQLGGLAVMAVGALRELHLHVSPMNDQLLSWSDALKNTAVLPSMNLQQRESLKALGHKNDNFISKHAGAINASMKKLHHAFPSLASMVTRHDEVGERRYQGWLEDTSPAKFYHRGDKLVSLDGEIAQPERDDDSPPFENFFFLVIYTYKKDASSSDRRRWSSVEDLKGTMRNPYERSKTIPLRLLSLRLAAEDSLRLLITLAMIDGVLKDLRCWDDINFLLASPDGTRFAVKKNRLEQPIRLL